MVKAQVWLLPIEMLATPDSRLNTRRGVFLSVVVPSPNLPQELSSQHKAAPSEVTAQVCWPPAEMPNRRTRRRREGRRAGR